MAAGRPSALASWLCIGRSGNRQLLVHESVNATNNATHGYVHCAGYDVQCSDLLFVVVFASPIFEILNSNGRDYRRQVRSIRRIREG